MDELLDHAPCGYISFKDDGLVVAVNQTLADLLALPKVDVIGRNVENILTVASRIFHNTHLFPLLRLQGKADEIFMSLRGNQKNDIPILLNATRKKVGHDAINELILIPINQRRKFEDELLNAKKNAENAIKENQHLITLTSALEARTIELDQQYSRLVRVNKDHFQFSKVISHDLQETLHKMSVFSDKLFIEESANLSDKGKKNLEKITNAIAKANDLINGLHNFIQVNEGDEFLPVDLNQAIIAAKEKAAKNLEFNHFEFEVERLAVIEGNQQQLEEMFYQLIANSIHYREPKRKLKIVIEHALLKENKYKHLSDKYDYVDHVKILFKDNGMGFDSALNDYVFALFKKIHLTSSGLGIGLALTKKIVENHLGSITVNTRPGEGTEFTIILPLAR